MTPITMAAQKIAILIKNEKHDDAFKMWKDEIKDLKVFECVVLKDKIHKIVDAMENKS